MTNISSQVVVKREGRFGQWMNSSIIHDNTCSLILKKCHPKRHHSDLNYHMTLTMVPSVLIHVLSFYFAYGHWPIPPFGGFFCPACIGIFLQ